MEYDSSYSEIYDIVTCHKDYKSEVEQLEKLLIESISNKNDDLILSIGCGTGSHEIFLAMKKFKILGIDPSYHMLEGAKKKNNYSNLKFLNTTLQELSLSKKATFAYSLFNVVNCLSDLSELISFFCNLNRNLQNNSNIFIECWNAIPCIIDPPKSVLREYKDDSKKINLQRTADPINNLINQKVIINYKIKGEINEKLVRNSINDERMIAFYAVKFKEINFNSSSDMMLDI